MTKFTEKVKDFSKCKNNNTKGIAIMVFWPKPKACSIMECEKEDY